MYIHPNATHVHVHMYMHKLHTCTLYNMYNTVIILYMYICKHTLNHIQGQDCTNAIVGTCTCTRSNVHSTTIPHPQDQTESKLEIEPVNVKRSDNLGEREVLSNGTRNADLVNCQVGVWCDDSSGREVHPFPHQVSSDTPLFGL